MLFLLAAKKFYSSRKSLFFNLSKSAAVWGILSEGYSSCRFHQVDSDDLTIAVDFWWQSNTMSCLSEQMDAYYFCRILRRIVYERLAEREMNQVLDKVSLAGRVRLKRLPCEIHTNGEPGSADHGLDQSCQNQDLKGKEPQQRILLQELGPCSLQALHELVSLFHDRVNNADINQYVQSISTINREVNVKNEYGKIITTEMFCLEDDDDPIAKILWNLKLHTLQEVCLPMAVSLQFPLKLALSIVLQSLQVPIKLALSIVLHFLLKLTQLP